MSESGGDSANGQAEAQPGRLWMRLLGLALIIAAALTAVYLTVGYFAWQSGQTLREQQLEAQRAEQLTRQLDLARTNLTEGSYNLALRRVEWVLERAPDNDDAQALQRQVEAALRTALTPQTSSQDSRPLTPQPVPSPTPDPSNDNEPAAALARLERLAEREAWDDLLSGALAFQRQFPAYERLQTDAMLYDAYLNRGLAALQGSSEEVEVGLYYLSQARQLGDLPQEAQDYQLWAELYLQGIAYYGVNWSVSASVFRDLCLAAPFYQGACDKLFTSLLAYGDQFAFQEEWCPAADLYREARQYDNQGGLRDKITEATEKCAAATPTPEVISGTVPLTETVPLSGTEALEENAIGE